MPRFNLLPKNENFLGLFEASAQNAVKASKLLKELVDNYKNTADLAAQITELEHSGDTITHKIMAQLHRTFVTSFDREDIAALASALDDVMDLIESAADTMNLYQIESPDEKARALADIIVRSTIELESAISQLQRHAPSRQILDLCVEINSLENQADNIFRSAKASLFKESKDAAYIMKWHEIFQIMENATDRCEDVSNVIEGIVLKNA